MNRPAAAVVLMLALLLQGLASAWAAPMVLQRAAPPATSEVAPPCHEHAPATATSAAKAEPAHGGRAMNCCDDGIDCTHCSAACGTPPVPLATIAQFDDYIDAHFALILRSDAVLLAHPLGLLRPPITFHG